MDLAYPAPMKNSKSILITGCSSGIGRCVAEGLKSSGYRVIATARRPQDVDILAAQGFDALPLDLDNSQSITQAVEEMITRLNERRYGRSGRVHLTMSSSRKKTEGQ